MTGADGADEDDEARRRRKDRKKDSDGADVEDLVEAPGMVCDGCSVARRTCSGRRGGGNGCDGCDACDLLLMSLSLSAVLQLVAGVLPRRRGTDVVVALIRSYQRLLTRFTPCCPQTPSCSAYAVDAVRGLGPRRGIRAAAARIRACGMPAA